MQIPEKCNYFHILGVEIYNDNFPSHFIASFRIRPKFCDAGRTFVSQKEVRSKKTLICVCNILFNWKLK